MLSEYVRYRKINTASPRSYAISKKDLMEVEGKIVVTKEREMGEAGQQDKVVLFGRRTKFWGSAAQQGSRTNNSALHSSRQSGERSVCTHRRQMTQLQGDRYTKH